MIKIISIILLFLNLVNSQWIDLYGDKNVTILCPFGVTSVGGIICSTIQKFESKITTNFILRTTKPVHWTYSTPLDGSTVGLTVIPQIIYTAMVNPQDSVNYTLQDTGIVYVMGFVPMVLIAPKTSPLQNLQDVLNFAKTRSFSESLNIAYFSTGSSFHLASLQFAMKTTENYKLIEASFLTDISILLLNKTADIGFVTTTMAYDLRNAFNSIAVCSQYPIAELPTAVPLPGENINIVEGNYFALIVPNQLNQTIRQNIALTVDKWMSNLDFINDLRKNIINPFFIKGTQLISFLEQRIALMKSLLYPNPPASKVSVHPSDFLLYFVLTLYSVTMIACILGFLVLYKFGHTPVFKTASTNFLIVMMLGIVISYQYMIIVSIFELSVSKIDINRSFICQIQPWILGLGFDITFGALFLKTYRLYKIFDNTTSLEKVNLKDKTLASYLISYLSIQMLFLIIWTVKDPLLLNQKIIENTSQVIKFMYVCRSENMSFWITTSIISRYFILIVGLILAIKARNVDSDFNEIKPISFCIYALVIFCGLFYAVFSFSEQVTLQYILSGLGTWICISCVLVGLIGWKVIIAVFHPELNVVKLEKRNTVDETDSSTRRDNSEINLIKISNVKSNGVFDYIEDCKKRNSVSVSDLDVILDLLKK